MAKLTEAQKTFIVQQLACWRTPTEVAEAVVTEWPHLKGEVDRRRVWDYHPDRAGRRHVKKWRSIFDATRVRFVREIGGLGIAHAAFRLRKLTDVMQKAERMGNYQLVLQCLEQAAKETTGAYGIRREYLNVDLDQLSDEQLQRLASGEDLARVLASAGKTRPRAVA